MTALDVFRRYADADRVIEGLKEKIERREVMATGCTARPLSADGGGRGSGDASMRLANYVGDVEELRNQLGEKERQKKMDLQCCFFLAEGMSQILGKIMLLRYVENMTIEKISSEIHYSLSQTKRFKRDAEDLSKRTEIVYWDGKNVPLTVIRDR